MIAVCADMCVCMSLLVVETVIDLMWRNFDYPSTQHHPKKYNTIRQRQNGINNCNTTGTNCVNTCYYQQRDTYRYTQDGFQYSLLFATKLLRPYLFLLLVFGGLRSPEIVLAMRCRSSVDMYTHSICVVTHTVHKNIIYSV